MRNLEDYVQYHVTNSSDSLQTNNEEEYEEEGEDEEEEYEEEESSILQVDNITNKNSPNKSTLTQSTSDQSTAMGYSNITTPDMNQPKEESWTEVVTKSKKSKASIQWGYNNFGCVLESNNISVPGTAMKFQNSVDSEQTVNIIKTYEYKERYQPPEQLGKGRSRRQPLEIKDITVPETRFGKYDTWRGDRYMAKNKTISKAPATRNARISVPDKIILRTEMTDIYFAKLLLKLGRYQHQVLAMGHYGDSTVLALGHYVQAWIKANENTCAAPKNNAMPVLHAKPGLSTCRLLARTPVDEFKQVNCCVVKLQINFGEIWAQGPVNAEFDVKVLDGLFYDYNYIITDLRNHNNTMMIIVVGPNPINSSTTIEPSRAKDPFAYQLCQKVDSFCKNLSLGKHEVKYISVIEATKNANKPEMYNGLHPGPMANLLIAREVYVQILDLLTTRAEIGITNMKHISLAKNYDLTDTDKKYVTHIMGDFVEYKELIQKSK